MKPLRVVFWGTYDRSKPRVRLVINGAERVGMNVMECHCEVWENILDKSQIEGLSQIIKIVAQLMVSYIVLIKRYLLLPKHDAVIISYPGPVETVIIWPFALIRGVPVIWDVFISIYDTVVNDRKMFIKQALLSKLIYLMEWLACRAATKIYLDTNCHARYFENLYGLPLNSVKRVLVGAEAHHFIPSPDSIEKCRNGTFTVLYYGQFIPLHGVEYIIKAAKTTQAANTNIQWIIVGTGQEQRRIDQLIEQYKLKNIKRVNWIPYDKLPSEIHNSNIALGIFGKTEKAKRVIPNKAFQIMATGGMLFTADTPAIRELLSEFNYSNICLVPVGDPEALASAILEYEKDFRSGSFLKKPRYTHLEIGEDIVGKQFESIVRDVV